MAKTTFTPAGDLRNLANVKAADARMVRDYLIANPNEARREFFARERERGYQARGRYYARHRALPMVDGSRVAWTLEDIHGRELDRAETLDALAADADGAVTATETTITTFSAPVEMLATRYVVRGSMSGKNGSKHKAAYFCSGIFFTIEKHPETVARVYDVGSTQPPEITRDGWIYTFDALEGAHLVDAHQAQSREQGIPVLELKIQGGMLVDAWEADGSPLDSWLDAHAADAFDLLGLNKQKRKSPSYDKKRRRVA